MLLSEFEKKIDSLDGSQESDQACYHVMYGKEIVPWFERFMDLMRENEELQEQKGKVQRMDEKESYICDLISNDLPKIFCFYWIHLQNLILLSLKECKKPVEKQ